MYHVIVVIKFWVTFGQMNIFSCWFFIGGSAMMVSTKDCKFGAPVKCWQIIQKKILEFIICNSVLCSDNGCHIELGWGLFKFHNDNLKKFKEERYDYTLCIKCTKGGFKSLSWAENLNKLFTVLGGKFKFSAQDSDLEYLFWRSKNPPVSSDLKPPLGHLLPGLLSENPSLSNVKTESIKIEN